MVSLVLSRSVVSNSGSPWTIACQAPLSMEILQARTLNWVAYPFSRGASWPRNWIRVSYMEGRLFTSWATREDPGFPLVLVKNQTLSSIVQHLHPTMESSLRTHSHWSLLGIHLHADTHTHAPHCTNALSKDSHQDRTHILCGNKCPPDLNGFNNRR